MIERCLLFALLGGIWGSFLNVVAFRLLHDQTPFFPRRSYCPACKQTLTWPDLIPIFSFIFLKGKCRTCSKRISWLYPFIESTTALTFALHAVWLPLHYLPASLIVASLFVITLRTDLEARVIFRLATLFALPFVYGASYLQILPTSFITSLLASITTYLLFHIIRWIAAWYAQQEALGLGDVEIMTLIAALCGPFATWLILTIATTLGTLHGLIQKFSKRPIDPRIPLGAYLALVYIIIFPIIAAHLR